MKVLNVIAVISGIVILGFCFMFRESIDKKISEAGCTKFSFYNVSLSMCDDDDIKKLQAEKDSI